MKTEQNESVIHSGICFFFFFADLFYSGIVLYIFLCKQFLLLFLKT